MKKEELPILIGLVLVGFFMLFILASSTSNLNLTGYAVLAEYISEENCTNAGYTWESLTEENCTAENVCANETSDCEPCLEYEDINGTQGDCISFSSCVEEVCTEEETCEDVVVGGQCTGEVCDSDNLNLCDETNCDGVGYWYDSSCNADEETCAEEWNCGSWSDCSGTSQIRTCTDTSECGTEEDEEETTLTESTTKTVEQIIAEMEASQNTSNEEEISEEKNSESLGEITGG
ncbi:MAG: hypothetical protein KJ566_02170, partial [Nanoarchaeota archaeon]|nr:hypothetical protein [Nanoarchaeota archaeon]